MSGDDEPNAGGSNPDHEPNADRSRDDEPTADRSTPDGPDPGALGVAGPAVERAGHGHERLSFTRSRLIEEGWTRERLLGLFVVWCLLVPVVLPSFQVYLFTEFLLLAVFATAFNLLYGYTGLLSFGHALFYAAAGYAIALTFRELGPELAGVLGGISPLATLLVAVVLGLAFTLVIAAPVGYLSVRLDEIYFALITLSFSMAFYAVLIQDPYGLTQGSDGMLLLLGTVELFGADVALADRNLYYYLVLGVAGGSMYAMWRVINSPFGTVCRAIRESPDRVSALGVNVTYHQWVMFVVSAFFVGIAGLFIAPLHSIVTPAMSFWTTSAIPVVAAVIGGAFYFLGPAVGAFVFLYLRWGLSRYPAFEAHWELFYGLVLILVLLYFKEGAAAGLVALGHWLEDLYGVYRTDGRSAAIEFVRSTLSEKAAAVRREVGRTSVRGRTSSRGQVATAGGGSDSTDPGGGSDSTDPTDPTDRPSGGDRP